MNRLRKIVAWTWGLIRSPYPTAEIIAADGDPLPGLILFCLLTGGAMAVHSGAVTELARGYGWEGYYFLRQCALDLAGLFLGTAGIFAAVKLCGGETTYGRILAFWSFSYLPTAFFFGGGMFGIIVLRKIFGALRDVPQPIQLLGFFFAALMLLWKSWLLLTTLRVVGNLTIAGVVRACLILAALLFCYWWALWALGWQWVPYI